MKPSSLVLLALFAALLAVSATAWPHPHPHFPHPHPHFPYPKGHAFPPLPPLPSTDDLTKCQKAASGSGGLSCRKLSYNAENCCTYLSGLEADCGFLPYYKSLLFKGIVAYVCPAPASPPSA